MRVDVRIVAATNRDLKAEAEAGALEDLYYRLNVTHLDLPSLRARTEDVPLLAHHFLKQYAEKNAKEIGGITRAAHDVLLNWSWPGNVRELENAIERAVVLAARTRSMWMIYRLIFVSLIRPANSASDWHTAR